MLNNTKLTFIACDGDFESSDIVIFGAPFDGTTSYRPGARFAPPQIRGQSYGIETYSPYQNKDLTDFSVCDCGDIELPFGNAESALQMIYQHSKSFFDAGKLPILLGGEHLVSLGAIKAAAEKYKDLCIVHFDAHTDLRQDYLGETLSHATVMKRAFDILGEGRIFQFCIRSGEAAEFEFAAKHNFINKFNFDRLDEAMAIVGNRPIYLTIDLDCLDPSEFPGTGTPEAGGVKFIDLLHAIKKVCKGNVIGADLVELSPPYDPSGISTALTCKTLRELIMSIKK